MTPEQFEQRYGDRYRIIKVTRFKRKDNLHLACKDEPTNLCLYLKKHFEELPIDALDWVLARRAST